MVRRVLQSLEHLGWVQSSTQFEAFNAVGKHLETHKSIVKVLTAMLGPAAPAVALVFTSSSIELK